MCAIAYVLSRKTVSGIEYSHSAPAPDQVHVQVEDHLPAAPFDIHDEPVAGETVAVTLTLANTPAEVFIGELVRHVLSKD